MGFKETGSGRGMLAPSSQIFSALSRLAASSVERAV